MLKKNSGWPADITTPEQKAAHCRAVAARLPDGREKEKILKQAQEHDKNKN